MTRVSVPSRVGDLQILMDVVEDLGHGQAVRQVGPSDGAVVGFGEVDESVASVRVFQQHAADVDVLSQFKAAIFDYLATRVVKLEVLADPGSRRSGPDA
jgi:hypothetical protein